MLIAGLLTGYADMASQNNFVAAIGGSYLVDGQTVRGYGIAVDGRVTQVIPDGADALTKTYATVDDLAKAYTKPRRITGVLRYSTGQVVVFEVSPHAATIH